MITVIDLGNCNVKGINDSGRKVSFKSNLSRDYESYPDGFSYILLDGEYTYFEKGTYSKEYKKTNKDYRAQLLYGISKLSEDKEVVDTNITLLLPISQMEYKKTYEEQLKNKEFKFTAKSNKKIDKMVKIKDVLVLPEGYASYFVLDEKIKFSNVLIIDIGGRTSNVIAMDKGKPQVLETYKIGILDFYLKLKNLNGDKQYRLEDIEKAINKGDIKVSEKELAAFTNTIINEISITVNINHYDNVIFTGGGSLVLKEIINNKLPKQCRVLENALYSNINGALEASKEIWNKESK